MAGSRELVPGFCVLSTAGFIHVMIVYIVDHYGQQHTAR